MFNYKSINSIVNTLGRSLAGIRTLVTVTNRRGELALQYNEQPAEWKTK